MFSRWLFVRLNAAEKALRQGRLDDAYEVALQPEVRQQARGQRLLDELVKPLVARARLHRQAGRYAEAMADLDRVDAIGRADPDVKTLRQQIASEVAREVRREAQEQAALGRVENQFQAGRLETGRLDLERVDDTRRREELAEELNVRVRRGGQLLQQAVEALQQEDVLAAMQLWQDACQRHGRTRDTDQFAGRLGEALEAAAGRWCNEGRLDRLMAVRRGLAGLLSLQPRLGDVERLVSLCERGVTQLTAADYAGLRQTLLRMKALRGDVAWVNGTLAALAQLAEAQDVLLAGPLGLYATQARAETRAWRGPTAGIPPVGIGPGVALPGLDVLTLERPLLVLVDGGGSNLLVRGGRVRLGRGGAHEVDVPLPGDVQSHHADVMRRGEDYFLTAYGPTQVNHRHVQHVRLRDGDRITLGSSTKMVFLRPSAKSQSAVLRMSHRCRLPLDVSQIILFQDTCLLGPAASCHVQTHEGDVQIVLFERGGGLHARQTAGAQWQSTPTRALQDGQTLEFGELRVTVRAYDARRDA